MTTPSVPMPSERFRCPAPEVPEGYDYLFSDTLGSYSLYAFATRFLRDERDAEAWDLAGAWSGDEFSVLGRDEEDDRAVVALWSLHFDEADHAALLQTAIRESELSTEIRAELSSADDTTLHVIASTRALPDDFTSWSGCGAED